MTKRITPEIVIKSEVINSCWNCYYFQEYHDEYDGDVYTCMHPSVKGSWGKCMNERGKFETEPDSEIWVGCPLPKVDTVSEGES